MRRFNSLQEWLDWQEQFHPWLIDLGLKRVAQVFERLHPVYNKPLTITVGGTNGKGSCIAFLEAIYQAQGYKVGAYTSPHILHYNERIKIDGQPVDDTLICEAFSRIEEACEDVSLSSFEFGTLAAIDIFSHADLDIQLLEVGLGGRLDAVNIVATDLAIITSIAIDHVDWLGETRESIGREKAGILKKNVPAVIGDMNPPDSLIQVAKEKGTPLFLINKDFFYHRTMQDWTWKNFTQNYAHLPNPALKGEHQFNNASTVLMAVTQLQDFLSVDQESINSGLKTINLNGRFQLIEGNVPILVDVAHNPQAVKMLVEYLKQNFADKKIHAIFSIMKDKDVSQIIDIISDNISHWFISPLNTPRAISENALQALFTQKKIQDVTFGFQHFTEAMNAATQNTTKNDLILVFGSFFLVSECLKEFEND